MAFWSKRKKKIEPPKEAIVPGDMSAYAVENDTPPYVPAGNQWAPSRLETLSQQYGRLNHYDRPAPDKPPAAWSKYHAALPDKEYNPGYATNPSQPGKSAYGPEYWNSDQRGPQPMPTRIQREPMGYSYMRPFDQWAARSLNGNHFAHDDQVRPSPIGTMRPNSSTWRNTYRVNPTPWDQNVVDMPPNDGVVSLTNDTYQGTSSTSLRRSYRLGG